MKKIMLFATSVLLSAIVSNGVLYAADSAPPSKGEIVRQKAGETVDAIKSYSIEKKEEAVKKAKQELDEFDAKMEKLEQEIKEKKAQWSAAIAKKKEEELAELKQQRAKLEERYANLKNASKKAWYAAKDAFVRGYHTLEHKFNQLKNELKEEEHKEKAPPAQ